jgi:GDP-4-dehydro-6-deoxy-D-mannose reductase
VASKKILITGAQGFVGARLLSFLQEHGHSTASAEMDLLEYASVERCLKVGFWDQVIHLAGISHVPTCEKDPGLAYRTNVNGTALLLEAMARYQPQAQLIFTSTAQVYEAPAGKEITEGAVFTEDRRIAPQNLYARTKWQSELLIQDAAQNRGLSATILRLFNHTHRSQSPIFFLPHLYTSLSSALKETKTGEVVKVPVGNLDISRDIGTLSDLLGAFNSVIDLKTGNSHSSFNIFNVCSGKSKNLGKLAELLARSLGVRAQFVVEQERVRPGEPKDLVGSHQKLTEKTGWQPHCQTEEELVREFLK